MARLPPPPPSYPGRFRPTEIDGQLLDFWIDADTIGFIPVTQKNISSTHTHSFFSCFSFICLSPFLLGLVLHRLFRHVRSRGTWRASRWTTKPDQPKSLFFSLFPSVWSVNSSHCVYKWHTTPLTSIWFWFYFFFRAEWKDIDLLLRSVAALPICAASHVWTDPFRRAIGHVDTPYIKRSDLYPHSAKSNRVTWRIIKTAWPQNEPTYWIFMDNYLNRIMRECLYRYKVAHNREYRTVNQYTTCFFLSILFIWFIWFLVGQYGTIFWWWESFGREAVRCFSLLFVSVEDLYLSIPSVWLCTCYTVVLM